MSQQRKSRRTKRTTATQEIAAFRELVTLGNDAKVCRAAWKILSDPSRFSKRQLAEVAIECQWGSPAGFKEALKSQYIGERAIAAVVFAALGARASHKHVAQSTHR